LIDPHVHLREPGGNHKEEFLTGTAAALAGGFTTILAMPNTDPPIVDGESLELAATLAASKSYCDYGFYLGASEGNIETASALSSQVCGMKMYLNQTFGPLGMDQMGQIESHVAAWPASVPIAAHAEGKSLAMILLFCKMHSQRIHICHVSRKDEIELIKRAKARGYPVTCEVTPHHLFLTEEDVPQIGEGRAEVRPILASKEDQEALWANLDVIDCFATDHAPHTLQEKDSETPPPGFPGLETALSLFLGAVQEGRLSMEELIERMVLNPSRIFSIPIDPATKVLVDPDVSWEVHAIAMKSKCGWSPYEGMKLKGKVREVILRGELVYGEEAVRIPAGIGRNVSTIDQLQTSKEV
jgi:carbamoyl-phosphate synthase/aspartate carbamoyltransferase/dihydroorotase